MSTIVVVGGPTSGKSTLARLDPEYFIDMEHLPGWKATRGDTQARLRFIADVRDSMERGVILTSWWKDELEPDLMFLRSSSDTLSVSRERDGDAGFTPSQVVSWKLERQARHPAARMLGRNEYLSNYEQYIRDVEEKSFLSNNLTDEDL
jgi:hypothetical protein